MKIKFNANISKPEESDCPKEIKKNGEKSVPLKNDDVKDFKKHRIRKLEKFKFNDDKITMFESPSLKNANLGKKNSA